jgi:hypothetical protein
MNIAVSTSRNPVDKRYIDPATIAPTTAALLVLQTRVKFRRGQNGKWSVEVETKAAGNPATIDGYGDH